MRAARALWLLYVLFILYGGTIPFHFAGVDGVLDRLSDVPLNPLIAADTGRRLSIPDAVQNILLFVPFGALGIAAGTSLRAGPARLLRLTVLGLLLSLAVESLQLFMANRVASTSDVLMNTIGALVGAMAAGLTFRAGARAWARLTEGGLTDVPEIRSLMVSGAVLAIALLQPFDVTLEVGAVAWKMRALEADIWQRTIWRDEGIVILLASLFAMALASYLAALGERHAAIKASAIGALAVVCLEASQLLIASRLPGAWDASVGVFGITLGAGIWSASFRLNWPAFWRGILIAMTALAAGVQMLSPFEWTETYHGFGWFPFLGYYTRTTFETLSHVIELALAYFPLGYSFALGWRGDARRLLMILGCTLAIAAPIEYLQGWVAGRYPDVSDIAVSLAGAWAGYHLGRTKP